MKNSRRLSIAFVLSCLFVIGFALMGFEMLGSRYLNPYFGGGITTWASLISVVLLAMMLGYYGGGFVVDSFPGLGVLIISVLTARHIFDIRSGLCRRLDYIDHDDIRRWILGRPSRVLLPVLYSSRTLECMFSLRCAPLAHRP